MDDFSFLDDQDLDDHTFGTQGLLYILVLSVSDAGACRC